MCVALVWLTLRLSLNEQRGVGAVGLAKHRGYTAELQAVEQLFVFQAHHAAAWGGRPLTLAYALQKGQTWVSTFFTIQNARPRCFLRACRHSGQCAQIRAIFRSSAVIAGLFMSAVSLSSAR